jgi:D-alanine transaminase
MNPIFYYDGRLFGMGEAAFSFQDRAIFFGDAVYDACLSHNAIPYLLDLHIDRFFDGMKRLSITPPTDKEALAALLSELCRRAECETAFLYFQASRCADVRRHFFKDTDASRLMITVSEFASPRKDTVLRLILTRDRRYEYCNVKTTNLLPAVLASSEARRRGADEAVFVRDGMVTECAHSNISILKNGVLFTHPTDRRILPGIARKRLIDACHTLKIPVFERPFSAKELTEADEIFVTSTSRICHRAGYIGKKAVGMRDEDRARQIEDLLFSDFYQK